MRGDWQNANTVCSNYPWAIYSPFLSAELFFSTFRQDVCNEARCLCDNLACSKASVTDDAVLDRKEKKNAAYLEERCAASYTRSGSREQGQIYSWQEEKKILTICTLVHPTLKRHCKKKKISSADKSQFHLEEGGRGAGGGCMFLSKKPPDTNNRDFSGL